MFCLIMVIFFMCFLLVCFVFFVYVIVGVVIDESVVSIVNESLLCVFMCFLK